MSLARVATVGLLAFGAAQGTLFAAPVPVRFSEGAAHGFLLLRSLDGTLLATGDLLQVARGASVEKRLVFHFTDGSRFEESVTFNQNGVYALTRYRVSQRGAMFSEDVEISLDGSGTYRVETTIRKDGRSETIEGKLDLPSDVYNGMLFTVVKDLPVNAGATVHYVVFMPEPRLIQFEMIPDGEQRVRVGELTKSATHYILKPRLGAWTKLFAKLLGRTPPDEHVWVLADDVPAFVGYEGPLYPAGPVWRIELTSPLWPE